MNKKSFFTMAAVAAIALPLAMTSCDSNIEEAVRVDSKVELRLSSGIEAQLRASFPEADTQIPDGRNVAVYVYEAGGVVPLYENNILTANGNGGLSGGETMYFPSTGNKVDIRALHTNAELPATLPVDDSSDPLIHKVSNNQETIEGYVSSDLLYATSENVAKTTSTVNLSFNHLLSKLQVAVKAGDGLTDADIEGITIGGTKLEMEFFLARTGPLVSYGPPVDASTSPIVIGADVSTNFVNDLKYNDVIIVPQTLAKNTAFITVHLAGGSDLNYRLPAETTFQSGKIYKYQLTANLLELSLTTSIEDWEPVGGDPVSGNATAEED